MTGGQIQGNGFELEIAWNRNLNNRVRISRFQEGRTGVFCSCDACLADCIFCET